MTGTSNAKAVTRYESGNRAALEASPRLLDDRTQQYYEVRFSVVCLCIGLFCSRFGISIGNSHLSLVAPMVLIYTAISIVNKNISFSSIRSSIFLLLCSLTFVSAAVQMINPDRFAAGFSVLSLSQFLLITSLATICFVRPVYEVYFFKSINTVFSIIAVLGIIQFAMQFVGFYLFSFKDIIPSGLTFETGFHLEIPIGQTKYFKSNGLLLLEPSMFSQYMALGLCIEILIMRRLRYLALLFVALGISFSGTGWIMLASFIIAVAFGMKTRGLVLAFATIGLLGIAMVALAVIAPDIFDLFWGRAGEFGAPGSSGHDRFIAPFWVLGDVIARAPWALWAGIGAGANGRLTNITYEFSQNTPIKLVIEFGIPVMLTYTALLVAGSKTRSQMILLVPAIVMLYFTSESAQLPPALYPVLIAVCLPTLRASSPSDATDRGNGSVSNRFQKR